MYHQPLSLLPLVAKLHSYHYIMSHPSSSSTQVISSLLDCCSHLLTGCQTKNLLKITAHAKKSFLVQRKIEHEITEQKS